MNKSHKIALSAIGATFSLVMVILAYYIGNISLSLNILASVGLMLPLSKGYIRESILACFVVIVIGAIFVNFHILPFALVTGSYTIVAVILHNKKAPLLWSSLLKVVFSQIVFFILFKLTTLITIDFTRLNIGTFSSTSIYLILTAVFGIAFLAYDYVLISLYKYLCNLFARIVK